MRIVFLGAGAFGLPTLKRLTSEHDVLAVVTQPDRKAGRGKTLTPTPIGAWAQERSLPLIKALNVNEPETCAQIRALDADAWVIIAFGQKLSVALLADRFAINLHASRLPRWRGAAPIHHAILAGDATTGNSVILLAQRMDAGDILAQSERTIEPAQTTGKLHDLLAMDGPDLVSEVLLSQCAGMLQPVNQDESQATRAPKLSRDDAQMDWSLPATACRNRIHALTPWPGVRIRVGDVVCKVLRAQVGEGSSQQVPGTLLNANEGVVACASGTTLTFLEIQPDGGRPMQWNAMARGRRLNDGLKVEIP